MIFDCVPPIFILRSVRSRAGPRPKKPGKKRSGKKAWARQSRPWHKGETPAVIRKNGWVVKRYDVTTFSVASSAAKTGTPHTHLQPSGCCGKIRKGYGGNNKKKNQKCVRWYFGSSLSQRNLSRQNGDRAVLLGYFPLWLSAGEWPSS